MPPLPKRKTSKARHGERRSHLKATVPAMQPCPKCHTLKLSHTVCPTCGTYAGEEIIQGKGKSKATKKS
jgi:large subunit ribosomal protein L32